MRALAQAVQSRRISRRIRGASFVRDAARSYGVRGATNAMIEGDNLSALAWLRDEFEGRFRCIYLDPPFNTGRVFDQYNDAASPETWRTEVEARLRACKPLLAEDGAIVVEIDDTELGTLILLMDDIFGREQRASIVTLTRSASTGHKAINRGPVNVTDYLLFYAKNKTKWRPTPLVCKRARYDAAYTLFVSNRDASPDEWTFRRLSEVVAIDLGFANRRDAVRAIGQTEFTTKLERFALAHAEHVARFAQPRYEAVSLEARSLIDRSRREKARVFVLERPRHKPMILLGGNRVLFLSDKVREIDGERVLVEPLTNVWNDIPFQGIAREGGVVFVRNKKPEKLIERVFSMCTDREDWVLDPYLGSGTTAAVAQKMGRRWVGIERGNHVNTLARPRLCRVIDGEDSSGITKAQRWTGGGGFSFYA